MKVIRGGTVVTASDAGPADVLIDGESIAAVGRIGDVDAEVIDATGCYVLPGAVDPHTHLKMPFGGTWTIDDYDTGTQAAAAGGTTLHRRLRAADAPRRARGIARGVAGPRRRHRARRLRIPHGDHQRHGADDRRHGAR